MTEKRIFYLNVIATILQVVGTLWLWIDSLHISARLPSEGIMLGDSAEYKTWYYHLASPIGFGLLLIGFSFSGVALWLSRPRNQNDKMCMNQIEKEISRSIQINQQLADMRQRGYAKNHKNDLLMAYFDIIFEHHEAVCLLIKRKLVGSGFVLVRPITETFLRAAWVNACSTEQQQAQLLADDNFKFPNMDAMVKEIGTAYSAETFFQMIKDNTWKSACSYTHSGLLQVSRRFDEDGYVAPNYSEAEILEVLRQTTTILLLAGILFFKSTGYDKEALEIENNWLKATEPN